jgi:hypothetical protein
VRVATCRVGEDIDQFGVEAARAGRRARFLFVWAGGDQAGDLVALSGFAEG